MGAALLTIAKESALPNGNLPWIPIKASNLLAGMSTISGLFGAFFQPLVGAIVDHSNKRWHIGYGSVMFLCLMNAIQICIGKSTWVFVAVLQLFAGYAYITHLVVIYAYLPELSNDPIELNRINSITNFFVYLGQFVFIVTAIVISFITGVDSIGQARISQVMVVAVGVIGYNYVWLRKMKSRPALQVMPEGASVLTIGFKKIRSTLWDLRHEYSPVLIFLCSIALAESATAAFVSIAVTYTTVVLEMEVKETGILIALVIFFGVPGSIIFRKITEIIGVHKSYMYGLLYWGVVTTLAPLFMNEPEHKTNSYLFGCLWGLGFGWLFPVQRSVYCVIIPGGSESELMGLYVFAGQILVWCPPLVFATLNQAHIAMSWGLVSDAAFFFIALAINYFFLYGDVMEKAIEKAKETQDKRIMSSDSAERRKKVRGNSFTDDGMGGEGEEPGVGMEDIELTTVGIMDEAKGLTIGEAMGRDSHSGDIVLRASSEDVGNMI